MQLLETFWLTSTALPEASNKRHFNEGGTISLLNDQLLKFVEQFIYLCNNISSSKSDVQINMYKGWTAINSLLTIWKSNLLDNMNWELHSEKKLD